MQKKVHGYILKSYDWREADRFFVFYSRELGKIRIVARGVKRFSSKLAGHLQLFSELRLTIVSGQDAYILIGVRILTSFRDVVSDLHRVSVSWGILGVLDALMPEAEPIDIYKEILATFRSVLEDDPKRYSLIFWRFVARVITVLGYAPELFFCNNCGKSADLDSHVSVRKGGIICGACFKSNYYGKCYSIDIDSLRWLFQRDVSRVDFSNITSDAHHAIFKILPILIEYHIGRSLPVIPEYNF